MTQPASADTKTEYGFKKPDGTIFWGDIKTNIGDYISPKDLTLSDFDGQRRDRFVAFLKDQAKTVGVDPDTYAAAWSVVKREVITVVLDHEVIFAITE